MSYLRKLALFGAGGHAMEVAAQIGKDIKFFVDDKYVCLGTLPISQFDPSEYLMMVAVGNSHDREAMVLKLPKETQYFTFIHSTALILDPNNFKLGEGSFIGAYSVVTTNCRIGRHAILNRAVHVGHDAIIGDYFSAMPGVIISGNVSVGHRVYFGTHSSCVEKISISSDVTIGLGAAIVNHLEPAGTYVGVPAKLLKKFDDSSK